MRIARLVPTRPDPTRPDPTRPDPTRPDLILDQPNNSQCCFNPHFASKAVYKCVLRVFRFPCFLLIDWGFFYIYR